MQKPEGQFLSILEQSSCNCVYIAAIYRQSEDSVLEQCSLGNIHFSKLITKMEPDVAPDYPQ